MEHHFGALQIGQGDSFVTRTQLLLADMVDKLAFG
jgi:hypothetical protein